MADSKKALNVQQKAFADNYFRLGLKNPFQAAVAAKYDPSGAKKRGAELLEDVRVREYLDSLKAQEKANEIVSRSEALKLLAAIARGETQEEVWINEYDPKTRKMQTVKRTKSASAKDRITALEVMLKFSEFDGSNDTMNETTQSTDDKLYKALKNRKISIQVEGDITFEEDAPDASTSTK